MVERLSRSVAILVGLGLALGVYAQDHPLIASYTLTVFDGGIRLDWSIEGGSTCDGQEVERSSDGISFTNVHRIDGICGDPSVAVPFNWLDAASPEFSTVCYRVKLGSDGYTSIKSAVFDQLTTSDQRFFPSPMSGEATLVVNVGSLATIDLRIWNSSGRLVFERIGASGPSMKISMAEDPAGVY